MFIKGMHKDLPPNDANFAETKAAYDEIIDIYNSVSDVLNNLVSISKC